MSTSGYTACPCCGYDTISDDMSKPELCSDCLEHGCAADGSTEGCPNRDEEHEEESKEENEEDYSWVTDEMFQEELELRMDSMSTESILAIPGVYELVSEELNNEVLEALKNKREEQT